MLKKKSLNYLFLLGIFCLINPIKVMAATCTLADQTRLQNLASQVKVTFEYDDNYYEDNKKINGTFKIIVSGLTSDLYALEEESYTYFTYNAGASGIATENGFSGGSKKILIYDNNNGCTDAIKTIELTIPKFNYLSTDPLCEGIDYTKFALCDKWYQFDVDYDIFTKRVAEYKQNNNQNPSQPEGPKEEIKSLTEEILYFVAEYYWYFISGIVILTGIIIYLVIKKRRGESL